MQVSLTPLTAEAFAPFGDLLSFDPSRARRVNDGTAWRSDLLGLDDRAPDASPSLAIYRVDPQLLPFAVRLFERHPQSPQCFATLTAKRFVVVVAPTGLDGLPDLAQTRAFVGTQGQGIRYRRGQWHAPMIALDAGGDMLMVAWESGTSGDCVEHRPPTSLVVTR